MKITLGTALEGGGVVTYNATFIDAIKLVDPVLEIRTAVTKGTLDTVSMLESGQLDIGLVTGEIANELLMGRGEPPTKLKVITVMYSMPGMFVVRADSRYHRITDFVGRSVVWNGRNSGIAVPARYVMDGLGLDIDRDFQPIYTDHLSFGPAMIADGRASALWGAGQRWPGFVEVANDPRGARFIAPDSDEIKRIHAKYNFLVKLTVPAGLYRGQTDPIDTVGAWSFVFARADLDDSIGYRLASALYKINRGGAFSSQLAETTPKNTIAAIPGPDVLQSGVFRFYKKMELLK